jgi:hypothetical protein
LLTPLVRKSLSPIRTLRRYLRLPPTARAECRHDRLGLPEQDPGMERTIDEGIAWLCRAQDHSASRDGGVARHFSLETGWGTSYPETTGYIVPTMLAYARLRGNEAVRQRARVMLDWLVSIQFPEGGFQGGTIGARHPLVPVTFNTGQILLGLASGVRELGDHAYRQAMCKAAEWLVSTQDPDGGWRRHPTPFAAPGEKAYETHVAWGLLETVRIEHDARCADAAMANIRWALRSQRENGWFANCCLTEPARPLTHTLGYALRGVIEGYRFTREKALLRAACKTADGLLTAMRPDGFLAGRLNSRWQEAVRWACLTGTAQIAICWLLLYQETGNERYHTAAAIANRYVRRTIKTSGPPETRGAVKGSFPVWGVYGRYQYLNWACKFSIDANMLEMGV